MPDSIIEPIRRFLEQRRMRAELKRLRVEGRLEQILAEADYVITGPAQGEWCHVFRKGTESDLSASLFMSPRKEEAIWWIVQRHREGEEARDR